MTPYEILSVPNDASLEDIERVWKTQVRKNHPDRFNGTVRMSQTATLARINAAYDQIRKLRAAPHTHTTRTAQPSGNDPTQASGFATSASRTDRSRCRAHTSTTRPNPSQSTRAREGSGKPTSTSSGGSSIDLESLEFNDFRRNGYRLITTFLRDHLKRSMRLALTLGLSEGRFTLAPLFGLPSFAQGFLPFRVQFDASTINIFYYGTPMVGDLLVVPNFLSSDDAMHLSRETFSGLTYSGWNNARTYHVGRLEKEGMDVTGLLPGAGDRSVHVFFFREYANPTPLRAIATDPLLKATHNWLYKIRR